jgi:hypothetical protein
MRISGIPDSTGFTPPAFRTAKGWYAYPEKQGIAKPQQENCYDNKHQNLNKVAHR